MFTGNKENTADPRANPPVQKSHKEKTMATSPANSMANIDLTKPLALEEQAWVKKRIQDLHGETNPAKVPSDSTKNQYQGKSPEKKRSDENVEAKHIGYVNKNAPICDNTKNHKATGKKISKGTKVEILEISDKYTKVNLIENGSGAVWVRNNDYSSLAKRGGFLIYTALYNDIEIYEKPF